ncbi:MAG TPA: GGDEF domain-containing protein [bacterium]|nr:GGDEF domain-containing protein [bacterium]HPN30945.1 GGDEF domain-containing protein [bacterium]
MNEIKKEFLNNSFINKVGNLNPVLVEDNLLKILAKDKKSEGEQELNEYQRFLKERQGSIYGDIIFYLTGLRFSEEEAIQKWNELLKHKYEISTKLGRNVGIKVSAVDYFYNITGELNDFTVVDNKNFVDAKIKTILDLHTGAFNKDFLLNYLSEICSVGKRKNYVFSVLFFDIDNYKKFNDTFGHILGDYLLISLVNFLKKNLNEDDLIFRFGGEEFVVFFPKLDKKTAFEKSSELCRLISEYNFQTELKTDNPVGITVSGGLVTFPDNGTNPIELLELADGYLYKSKRFGKNRILID